MCQRELAQDNKQCYKKANMGSHFKGKSVFQHLKEARKKGHLASKEPHGVESGGHLISGADAAREISIASLLLQIIFISLNLPLSKFYLVLSLFISGYFFWKVGRSASLGWARLERINNLIKDEKDEIENNRQEEKAELTAMYEAKGFTEPLLSKVIDVLMADDNKLLGIMLEEELGVSLESYEHPLKLSIGSAVGVFLASAAIYSSLLLNHTYGVLIAAPIVIFVASYFMAKIERIRPLNRIVWNLAITFLSASTTYFLAEFIKGFTS
jgi:hypothetical protein